MDRSRSRLRAAAWLAVLALAAAAPARADRWQDVRKHVIDPVNSEFHRHLPRAVQGRDLEQVLALYAVESGTGIPWSGETQTLYPGSEESLERWRAANASETIRERYRRLFELLPTIEKAELRIHRIWWELEDAEGIPADARMIVRGILANGSRGQVDQRVHVHYRKVGEDWRIASEEVTAREIVTLARPRFELATEKAGIRDTHENQGSPPFRMVGGTSASAGSAVGDVDGDGCEDVFLPGSPDARLYRNRCDGTFEDATEAAGIPRPFPSVATGAIFFDYDNDGRPDLFVTAVAGGNRLFHNVAGERGPRFVDVTTEAAVPEDAWSSMAVVADYDRDGWLDVYVVRMGDHAATTPEPNYQAANGLPNRLLRNEGNGTFRDVTREAGVGDAGWGLAGAWGDYDGDGFPDLYVANEYGYSVLYRNLGNGRFRDVGDSSAARIRTAGMGVAWGDYDGDGRLDLYVSAMYANSRWALYHPDFPAPVPWGYRLLGWFTPEVKRRTEQVIEDLTRGSTLLHNQGDGTFRDVSDAAGIRDAQWGWGAEFFDYDNDGRLDVFGQNGFVTGKIPDDV